MPDNTEMPTVAERVRRLWQIVRRNWILLVSVTVVAMAAAAYVASHKAKQYDATAKLVLANTELVAVPSSGSIVPNADPQADLNTKVQLILAPPVAEKVNSELHLGMTLQSLLTKVQTTVEGTSNIVDVTATDPSPARAMAIANGFVHQYVSYRDQIAQSAMEQSAAALSQQISQLSSTAGNATELANLKSELHGLQLELPSVSGGALVISPATNAQAASGHPVLVGALVGLFVGLLLAISLVIVLEVTDKRLRDADDVLASGFGVRVLSAIPRARQTRHGSLTVDASRAQAKGYDSVASQLLLAGSRQTVNTVLVTSPGAGDGKTTVTLGVARALSRLGRSVLVIETDSHSSVVTNVSTDNKQHGLTAVVTGTSGLEDEIMELPVSLNSADIDDRGISVLPAGSTAAISHQMAQRAIPDVISESRELADFVLIDGPSTGRFHDALGMIGSIDGALVVARLRWTNRELLHESLERLQMLKVKVLGLVLAGAGATPARRTTSGPDVSYSESGNGHGHPRTSLQQLSVERRWVGSPRDD